MILYSVTKRTFLGNVPGISDFHYAMFHGFARRGGAKTEPLNYDVDSSLNAPLLLTHNGVAWPHVILPSQNMVVDAATHDLLKAACGVKCLEVQFECVYTFPWRRFETWHDRRLTTPWPDSDWYRLDKEFAEWCRARFEGHGNTRQYFEVLPKSLYRVIYAGINGQAIPYADDDPHPLDDPFVYVPEMFDHYPLVDHGSHNVMVETMFNVLRDRLDPLWFEVRSVDTATGEWTRIELPGAPRLIVRT